jgi:hypothetical protein
MAQELEKPGVKVFQEFVSLSPTLIRPVLQEVLIGIARQVIEGETAGTYTGVSTTYAYPSILVGSTVDTSSVEVFLQTADGTFDITDEAGVTITTSGVTLPSGLIPTSNKIEDKQIDTVTAGDQFTDGGTNFFSANVQPGDILVFVTDPTEAAALGVSVSTNDATGGYVVVEVTDQNTLVLSQELLGDSNVAYSIVQSSVADGTVLISYVATRGDGIGTFFEFQGAAEAESLLGKALPENPLGLAGSIAVQNSDRVIAATMVESDTVADHLEALDLLEAKDVYAMIPLTQEPAIHQIYKTHVDLMSQPDRKKERIALLNREIELEIEYQSVSTSGSISGSSFTDPSAQFVTNEVPVGAYIELEGTPATVSVDGQSVSEIRILSVISETDVEIVGTADAPVGALSYTVSSGLLSKAQLARNLADYAASFNDRRIVIVEPDSFEVSVSRLDVISNITSSSSEFVTGDFAAVAVGGMISSLAASQPFTTLPIAGFTDLRRSNNFFSDQQQGVIRGGGIMLMEQAVPDAPITIQHQLTTAVDTIETRELSIVKAVDFSAKYIRNRLAPLVGRNNITDIFIDQSVRTTIAAIIKDLIDTNTVGRRTSILKIVQSETQPDTIEITIDFEVLFPANFINVTLLI